MASFDEIARKKAMGTMERMMNRPLSEEFNEEIVPGVDADDDYLTIVKRPMSLATIKKKITNCQYKTISEWFIDVETVWSNAELYNGMDTYLALAAQMMREIFDKEKRQFSSDCHQIWADELYRRRVALAKCVTSPPNRIKTSIPAGLVSKVPNPHPVKISPHDLQVFSIVMDLATSGKDYEKIWEIIDEKQPEITSKHESQYVVSETLNGDTMTEITKYVKGVAQAKMAEILE